MTDERKLEAVKVLGAYYVVKGKFAEKTDSGAMVLKHEKSDAKLFLLSDKDDNKIFCIGFRAPSEDSADLPHILEHNVLEGLKKFPVKGPFMELVKGSLNTFLNAMTCLDKTVYPVASCNGEGFQNLTDVYPDGVLHPTIYREPKIFLQGGWHYEMRPPGDELTINGVVYNEMKGVSPPPESVLNRFARSVLLSDSIYANESGGDPSVIPDLTYEQFIEFHKNYYHPVSSYTYLYGNMDIAEKFEWLDREYLNSYDRKDYHADSSIPLQEALEGPVEREVTYSVAEEEGTADRTCLSVNTVVGTSLDPALHITFNILEHTLISVPSAPLEQALIGAGIGQNILGGYDSSILQPYFTVIVRNANREQKDEFLSVVKGTLRELVDWGIDRKSLKARLNYYEFRSREADYGSTPKRLMYDLGVMDSWLYGGDPLVHLEHQKTFESLNRTVGKGYFEQLIHTYLLDNPYEAMVIVSLRVSQTAREDGKLAEHLTAYKTSPGNEEIARPVAQTKALEDYQEETSSQGNLEKISMLQGEDIDRENTDLSYQLRIEDGIRVIHSDMFTSGIGHLKVLFNIDRVPVDDLPYVELLRSALGYVDTEDHTYSNLPSEIHLGSGGTGFVASSYPDMTRPGEFTGTFVVGAKVFYGKLGLAFSILTEMLTRFRPEDEKRLGEILDGTRSRTGMKMEDPSHGTAIGRTSSYYSVLAAFNDIIGGAGYYQFLEYVSRRYSEEPEYRRALIGKLKGTVRLSSTSDNILVLYTIDKEGCGYLLVELKSFKAGLLIGGGKQYRFTFEKGNRNEDYKTAFQVNYVARCGSFAGKKTDGKEPVYTGALRVLKVILNYKYLQMNLRVKGGAYGCMSGPGRSGDDYLVSCRDLSITNTNQIYEGIPEYLEGFSIDEWDMTKYVIGTISDMDTPLTSSLEGNRGLSTYFSGVAMDMMQRERGGILNVAQEDIRNLTDIVRAVLNTGALCVIKSDEQIKTDRGIFGEIKNLYH